MRPVTAVAATDQSISAARAMSYLIPTLLGMALLGLVGFAHSPAVHDDFHDIRHSAGFPCH